MYAMQHIIPIHSMYSLQHSIPIQQVPDTANLVEDTHIAQDWSYTPTQQVLIAAYHSNTPLLHRTGQVSKHSLCSELGRYQNTHKRCRGLGKCINTPCAQDWTRYKNTHSAQGWTSAKTHRECIGLNKELQHSVHRTTQVQEHAECA